VDLHGYLERVRNRLTRTVLGQIAQAAAAAAISWELALQLPNHGTPFFAPMAAAIALNAELGRRGRQATPSSTTRRRSSSSQGSRTRVL